MYLDELCIINIYPLLRTLVKTGQGVASYDHYIKSSRLAIRPKKTFRPGIGPIGG
jgi:hypothetical protein